MRRLLLILLAISYPLLALAEIPKSPPSALKEIRKRYKEIKTLECSFIESFQWQLTGETVERHGTISIGTENRFRIQTDEQTIVSDGTVVYRYNKPRNQVMIEKVESAEALLPNKILLQFADQFEASSIAPLKVEGKEGYRLDLTPEDPDKALLREATLWVTTADMTVHRIKMVDLNGNSTTYTLSSLRFDQPIAPELLKYTPPTGAEIFDLR